MDELLGHTTKTGWTIDSVRTVVAGATGSCHSFGFNAKHVDGRHAFVKVLDPTPDPALDTGYQLKDLELRLALFNYEKDIHNKCLERGIKHVVTFIEFDSIETAGSIFYYILFELADQDLRQIVNLDDSIEVSLRFNILHQLSLGLESLHFNQIAHQDIKPSNVLLFEGITAKLCDFGHAHDRSKMRPVPDVTISGDPGYAPLEQLYGLEPSEWTTRRLATDLYLLGSLAFFMFTNVSLTARLATQLSPAHHWKEWNGSYQKVMPYVRRAWNEVVDQFSDGLNEDYRSDLESLVRFLTNPDPEYRGHPRNLAGSDNKYGVRRFSSRFQLLAKRVELNFPSKSIYK